MISDEKDCIRKETGMHPNAGRILGCWFKREKAKEVLPDYKGPGNPLLYFAVTETGDWVVKGVKTWKELLEGIEAFVNRQEKGGD